MMSANHAAKSTLDKYLALPQPRDKIQATYIWIDGSGEALRCKTRTIAKEPAKPDDLPIWNFDGSSTGQSKGNNSDVYLYPVAIYNDPFLGGQNKLVMCETYTWDKKPHSTNKRHSCKRTVDLCANQRPWFGIEQEYTLLDTDGYPYMWPKQGFPGPQDAPHEGSADPSCGYLQVMDSSQRLKKVVIFLTCCLLRLQELSKCPLAIDRTFLLLWLCCFCST